MLAERKGFMIPIVGFFVSKSIPREKQYNYMLPDEPHKNESSVPKYYWGNQEKYSLYEPKMHKEEELPCDRRLHL